MCQAKISAGVNQSCGGKREVILHASKWAAQEEHFLSLSSDSGVAFSHEDKAEALFQNFGTHFGRPEEREVTLQWEDLGLPRQDLSHLEDMFTEEEVLAVVQELAAEKAPGPDGFIGLFLKHSWGTIKLDIMKAFEFFSPAA